MGKISSVGKFKHSDTSVITGFNYIIDNAGILMIENWNNTSLLNL